MAIINQQRLLGIAECLIRHHRYKPIHTVVAQYF